MQKGGGLKVCHQLTSRFKKKKIESQYKKPGFLITFASEFQVEREGLALCRLY
jgi:hypothetical protein